MPSVVVLGDLVVDQILEIQRLPLVAAEHQRVRSQQLSPGGAANTLIMGARLGMDMYAVGVVGMDNAGSMLLDALRSERVNANQILRNVQAQTRTVYTLVAPSGEHVFLGYLGVPAPSSLPDEWIAAISAGAALFFDGWTYRAAHSEVCRAAAELAFAQGIPLFFDPGPEYPFFSDDWLKQVLACTNTLLVTEDELRGMLVDQTAPLQQLAERMFMRGVQRLVIKRGAEGCVLAMPEQMISHAGFQVTVRDTTGAGDVLSAAVIYATLHNFSPEATVELANAAGAAAVQKLGAGLNVPTKYEIQTLLREAGSETNLSRPTQCALLVIDVQNGFISAETVDIPGKVAAFIDESDFALKIFTRFENLPDSPFEHHLQWQEMQHPPETDLVSVLLPYAETVVVKHGYSSLTADVQALLSQGSIEELVIVGLETDACVLKTAFDAFDAGYRVRVISNLCATGAGDDAHQQALALLRRNIGAESIVTAETYARRVGQ